MKVSLINIPSDLQALQREYQGQLIETTLPAFESHREDIAGLKDRLQPFLQYRHILLVGNGGSIWSLMAYYQALADKTGGKIIVPLTDMEPDYLAAIRATYHPDSTLAVIVSKSGSTVGVIENLFYFADYPQLYVTDATSPLGQIGQQRGVTIIPHPAVGGRYSAFTSCAYAPAMLANLDIENIEKGGRAGYEMYRQPNFENPTVQVALALFDLENRNYTEVFLPIYSNFLQTFGLVITQLFHESFGKAGKGLTVFAAQAPESQHHTNQRFFGGRKNMVGCFIHIETRNQSVKVEIPPELQSIKIRKGSLADLSGLNLADSFHSEYFGTFTEAKNQYIPLIDITVSEVTPQSVGELMAFWHYVTVFSARLRGVDPYDQPQVEASKEISFEERLKSKAK